MFLNALTALAFSWGQPRYVDAPLITCSTYWYRHDEKAGILPGLTYYLSAWYPKVSLAKRIGVLYAGATLASAFGGLLAFAIEKMNGYDPIYCT